MTDLTTNHTGQAEQPQTVAATAASALPARPDYLADSAGTDMAQHATEGGYQAYPILSIGGRAFTVRRGDTHTQHDETFLDVIIVGVARSASRVFYNTDDSGAQNMDGRRPDCYSYDGVTPAEELGPARIADTCAACHNSQFGSRITPWGSKAQACASKRRIAVVAGNIDDPMLLSLPSASLNPFAAYGKALSSINVGPTGVVTRLSFEPVQGQKTFPLMKFSCQRYLTQSEYVSVKESLTRNADIIDSIVHPRPAVTAAQGTALPGSNSQRAIEAASAPAGEQAATAQQASPPPLPETASAPAPGEESVDGAVPGLVAL